MLRVGLTGGLASGKSFVARSLENLGCFVIHADDLGHDVLRRTGAGYAPVLAEFGESILAADDEIDRRKLAAAVFGDPHRLEILNGIVHPLVRAKEEEMIQARAVSDPSGIAVVEAAILIETGSYKRFDRLIVVTCSEEKQIERAMGREGATREDVLARLARQMPLSEKVRYADYLIDSSGTKEETLRQVQEVYRSLSGEAKQIELES